MSLFLIDGPACNSEAFYLQCLQYSSQNDLLIKISFKVAVYILKMENRSVSIRLCNSMRKYYYSCFFGF